jgi:hypothetical protein
MRKTDALPVADSLLNQTMPFLTAQRSRVIGAETHTLADGLYRVLATLIFGERSYRILADLLIDEGDAQLQFYRFDVSTQDEWFAERKLSVPVARTELAAIEQKVNGAEYVLCSPVRLDHAKAVAVFGNSGPPAV